MRADVDRWLPRSTEAVGSERVMERSGKLQFHSCVKGYHVYKDGDLKHKMKYLFANAKKKMHMTRF